MPTDSVAHYARVQARAQTLGCDVEVPYLAAASLRNGDETLPPRHALPQAEHLAAADEQLRQPGTPFLLITGNALHAGVSTEDQGGLWFANDPEDHRGAVGLIPVQRYISGSIDLRDDPIIQTAYGRALGKMLAAFALPRHILTDGSTTREITLARRQMLSGGVLAVNGAAQAILERAKKPDHRSRDEVICRRAAIAIEGFVGRTMGADFLSATTVSPTDR